MQESFYLATFSVLSVGVTSRIDPRELEVISSTGTRGVFTVSDFEGLVKLVPNLIKVTFVSYFSNQPSLV